MDYKPKTVDTNDIVLSEDLLELTEYLARNTHDTWAEERYAQGWKYGHNRDDKKKEHPCLVPYDDLPESEKVFDRRTALETLKTIVALGYEIEIPEGKYVEGFHKNNSNLVKFLKSKNVELKQLYYIWKEHDTRSWSRDVEPYLLASEKALELGEPLLAYNVIKEGEKFYPDNIRLKQLHGLSLARIGAYEEANKVLLDLYLNESDKSEETLGMLARTFKDLALHTSNTEDRKKFLKESIRYYGLSYDLFESIWAGINLSTLYLLLGKKEQAIRQSENVIKICEKQEQLDPYWLNATLGEANLIRENYEEALLYYTKAVALADKKVGVINTTRKNAVFVMRSLRTTLEIFSKIEKCLSVPKIITFTGHRIDAPGRRIKRFPKQLEKDVYEKILTYLKSLGPCVGYCSAANGADILFIEAMNSLGNPCHIIIPFDEKSFIKESVHEGNDKTWEIRFFNVTRNKKNSLYILEDQGIAAKQNSYEFANKFIYGMAKLKAKQFESLVFPLAVWHSDEALKKALPGGTVCSLKNWYQDSHYLELIDLKDLESGNRSASIINTDFSNIKNETIEYGNYHTKGILFSDTVNYTSLSDNEFLVFEQTVLGLVQDMLNDERYSVAYQNTWGDAVHIVFDEISATAEFAIELNERLSLLNWKELGFKKQLQMRIAIHVGQVIKSINPITKNINYNGPNICRAARLEPLTPPGQVYCTQEFAALMEASSENQYLCHYVGDLALPKGFGIYPIFNVRRALK